MNGIFEPIHKSYQLSTRVSILLGVFIIGTFYFAEKSLNANSRLTDCQKHTTTQAQEINQCALSVGDLNDKNRGLAAENQRLTTALEQARNTITSLEGQIAADQKQIENLRDEIKTLTSQHANDTLVISQLTNTLKAAEQTLAHKQALVDSQEQQLGLMQVQLSGLTALDIFLDWLGEHLYLSGPLLAALFAIPFIVPFKKSFRRRQKSGGAASQDDVRVRMTRQAAREYARRSRRS